MTQSMPDRTSAQHGTAMTQLDPAAGYTTIVNTYDVDPSRAEELLAFLIEASESTLRHVPGFVSANLHLSLDGRKIVNYAQWENQDAIAAARDNGDVAALIAAQSRIANGFEPVLYRLRAIIPAVAPPDQSPSVRQHS